MKKQKRVNTHPTIKDLSIELCPCCNGTYFVYKSTIEQDGEIYLSEQSLEQYLWEVHRDIYIENSTFDINNLDFWFHTLDFFQQRGSQNIMVAIFNSLYEKIVLNAYNK